MKKTLPLITSLCLLVSWLEGFSQNLSNRGKEFWVGYGHHQFMEPGQNNSQEMVLYFSAEQAANVTVTVQGRTASQVTNYAVPANTVIASNYMPKSGALDCRLYDVPPTFGGNGGEGLFNLSIHIESDVPIVAYAHTFGSASSGATMLMPVETYGYAYISLNSRQNYANNCFSWAYVVASHDDTRVEIIPSVTTRLGKTAGLPFYINLNKGQIYQIIGANPTNGSNALEVSGTKFKSVANAAGDCYPIAAFSGSSRTTNPISCGSGGGDNDNQQLFPTQAWGKRYLTAPTSRSTAANQFMTNSYKILVKDPVTVVKVNGVQLPLATMLPEGYYFRESSTADLIEADKPIMVAQFMTGGSCMGGGLGDPEMIYVSPVEQGIKRIGFYRNTRESISTNYLTLIIPNNGVSSLRIDGIAPPYDHSYPHPQASGYTVVIKRWNAAQAQCIVTSDSAFTAITYGLGSVESYGYNAGTLINNLSAVSYIHNTLDPSSPQHTFTCTNTPVELSVLMAYQPTRIDWLLSQLGTAITPNTDVTDMAPVSQGTVLVNGVTYYRYRLPGTYIFNVADTFDIPIRGYHPTIENCYNRENLTIQVIVKTKPVADFNFTHTGCTLDTAHFAAVGASGNFTIRDFIWTFPGPATATGQFVDTLLPPGTHNVNLVVISNEGCTSDTTKQITIYDKPPGNFMITPPSLCEGSSFTITDTSSAAIAVNQWYWDFGNGVTQTVTTGPSVTYTYPTYGTYTIRHVARSSASCVSDTISRVVTVYAKPAVSFTNAPAGCLDASGLVQFTGTASVPDGQALTTYAWNFGDPNANAGNPNTSVLQNPTHNYQQGTYTINFSATTANGCTKDTSRTITFNLKPQLTYAALSPVCENAAAFSVATANVTNAVPGTGAYSGPGTTTAGMFTPAIAGPGTHTIKYVFTSTAGCADSISQTILVHAKPVPNFTYPNSGCLPTNGQVQFTNTSTIADAQTMTWAWNFGDPNANAGNPNTSTAQHPTHNYLEGTYTINLTATSSNGCVKDTTITATFSLTPLLAYGPLPAVCENVAPVSVATASVTNGATGTGVYSGPGTNAAGMFDPAVAGPGTHTITYSYTTTGGCTATITQNILVHARPKPSFTFTTGCLAPNGQVQFTNTSTIADAQTMTWAWNFNDPNANAGNPNTSTAQNPTHNYGEGTYNVNLAVTSSNGCVKDTTIAATFAVTPALNYPPLTPVCQNPGAGPSTVAFAIVTNGVTGTGTYSGPGTTSVGMFDPNVAGPGIHTITYTFTSTGGCTQTINRTIEVYPRPAAAFTISNNSSVCLGQTVTLTSNSTIPSGTITNWNWNLGNGTTPSYTNGNPFTVNYSSANNYTVQLVAVSDRGCYSTPVSQTVAVHPLPVADFTLPAAICMPGGSAVFSNQTTVADNSGLSYQWNFGDGSGTSTATNPSYVYAASGSYNVSLSATSAYGCVHQVSKVLDKFYDKPIASFSVTPQELCQGTDNVFRDGSSAPNSTIQSWNWNFDDGTSSTATNPTKRFNTPGTFDVTLIVKNAVGCTSDPFIIPVTVHLQPVIDAGQSFVVPQGTTVQLTATANSPSLTFSWSPPIGLSNPSILRPTVTALQDQVYTLTATGQFGCSATDFINVKILKPVKVPNIFTPNGDGIHDKWLIPNLSDYPGATVEVFNRYGQQVLYASGYSTPWDGTYKGKDMPVGTYYYVIELKNGFKPITGSVTIVR